MITFDYNSSYRKGKLICDESILMFIRNHFSVKNPNASFIQQKLKLKGSNAKVPEREYAIQTSGMFDLGLYNEIIKFLMSESINEIKYTDEFDKAIHCGVKFISIEDTLKYPLRDYQKDVVEQSLRLGNGTVVVATGGGKSLIQASILENWKKLKGSFKCLLIVPGTGLVTQLLNDFNDYGVTFTYSGWTGELDTKGNYTMPLQNTEVVIVNTELLCSQFGNFKELVDVDLVLRDEAHGNKQSNQITKIITKFKTRNKFGFTGTLPKDKIDWWKIIGTFGPIIYEKNSKELRDEKYLSNVIVRILKLNHLYKARGYKNELQFIQTDTDRHNVIKKIVSKMDKNVLILVNRLEHGDHLWETLQFKNKETVFVHGGMPVEEREQIKQKMETNDNIVCIAMSSIFSTGINIKNLHYIIFASGGKSFIRIVQSIGRGLRLHESKEKLVIFDLYDNFKFSMQHVEERKSFYDEEQIPWKENEVNLL
jgi:superfamily II DNA or RNA helicase